MAKNSAGVRRKEERDDEPVDSFFEIPAAVLCATCGHADCPGCSMGTDHESGVIAIIPWERPGGLWARLWSTARATTQGAETFFTILPDGELGPALRFALLSELLAVGAMAAVLLPLVALALPGVALDVARNPALRWSLFRWLFLGVPALSAWMVLAHVTHGAALDLGARRCGGHPQRRRAVRFGLYGCGWDLMAGPFGAVVTLASKGARAMFHLAEVGLHVPGRASVAFLQGVYQLSTEEIPRAQRFSAVGAVVIALISGTLVFAAIAAVILF